MTPHLQKRLADRLNIALLFVALALVASACGASQREKTLKTSLVAVNATRDTWLAYDDVRQDQIIAKATSFESGKAELGEYRETQAKIVGLFVSAYRAIGVAAVLADDDASLQSAITAVGELTRAVAAVMKGGAP